VAVFATFVADVGRAIGLCCARCSLDAAKVPRYIRLVNAFPMTVTGKIQKFKIRDEMTQQLGLLNDKTA
jgi:acyl-coenzyme A synthetase/AMP-(fatty) acid ligase